MALKATPRRVVTPDIPIPFSTALEETVTPTAEKIVTAVLATTGKPAAREAR